MSPLWGFVVLIVTYYYKHSTSTGCTKIVIHHSGYSSLRDLFDIQKISANQPAPMGLHLCHQRAIALLFFL
jgi:hypothetical protein